MDKKFILSLKNEWNRINEFGFVGSNFTSHDYMKCLLFQEGRRLGFIPFPEYKFGNSRKRIDIVWVDSNKKVIFAFEIDRYIAQKSINKLSLVSAQQKFIISIGMRKKSIKTRIPKESNIFWLDMRILK